VTLTLHDSILFLGIALFSRPLLNRKGPGASPYRADFLMVQACFLAEIFNHKLWMVYP